MEDRIETFMFLILHTRKYKKSFSFVFVYGIKLNSFI